MKRLRLVPEVTNIDFFRHARITFGASVVAVFLSLGIWFALGLNFGIDFLGGTTIRAESSTPVDVGAYREALSPLGLGDIAISEVFDPSFGENRHVAMIRIQAQAGEESVTPEMIAAVEAALQTIAADMTFPSVESVGPKVS
ncbi:MAG: protein translocase subunit SecF, partial [Paracoccaceae bacterium]